jgi:hypothetical protein
MNEPNKVLEIHIMKNVVSRIKIGGLIASTVLWAGMVAAHPDNQVERIVVVTNQTLGADEEQAPVANVVLTAQTQAVPPAPPEPPEPPVANVVVTTQTQIDDDDSTASSSSQGQNRITIQTIEPGGKKKQAKPVTYLGLAVKEASEELSSQLGLKPGEGLTVILLAPGSPAEKADFHKNDVLVDLDGQMLVHPLQLQKLIQMHAEGDAVKLTFYRAGKKQTATVKLGKTTWDESAETEDKAWPGDLQNLQFQLSDLKSLNGLNNLNSLNDLNGQWSGMGESLARVGLDKAKVNREVKRAMEQARKAIQDAVRHASTEQKSLASVDRELEALARGGLDVDRDATVTVRSKRNSSRTMVQTDEDGTYIIEAGAKTRLTARDKDGKLLFEGEIDTPAEREKVPKEVWEKVKPMLDQIVAPIGSKPKTEGQFRGRGDLVKQSAS